MQPATSNISFVISLIWLFRKRKKLHFFQPVSKKSIWVNHKRLRKELVFLDVAVYAEPVCKASNAQLNLHTGRCQSHNQGLLTITRDRRLMMSHHVPLQTKSKCRESKMRCFPGNDHIYHLWKTKISFKSTLGRDIYIGVSKNNGTPKSSICS